MIIGCSTLGTLKWDLKMKLSAFLILMSIFQIHATSYSQKTRITLEMNDVNLGEVLDQIESKSEFKFFVDTQKINIKRRVSVKVHKERISNILNDLFRGTGISYEVFNKQILLKKEHNKQGSILKINSGTPPPLTVQYSISGTITDSKGVPLPGANIVEKGTTNGTQADFDGNFSISVKDENAVLVLSYIGYATKEIALNGRSFIAITLEESAAALDEVVLVAYGTQKKSSVSGSISTVETDRLTEIPAANLSNAITGVAPGVLVTQSGGKPGKASSVAIRAAGSFNGSNPVLYVIDGIVRSEYDFNQLNANEVENISILKDAAASAIYGARAANGVIVVTTKKGKIGKAQINYTTSFSIDSPTRLPEVQSTADYARHVNEALRQKNVPAGDGRYLSSDELEYFSNNDFNLYDKIDKSATTSTHALNVQGGTNRAKYFIGGTFFKGTGNVPNIENERYSLRANVSADLSDNLNVSLNLNTNVEEDEKFFWRWDRDNDDFGDFYRNSLLRGVLSPSYINGLPVGNFLAWHPGETADGKAGTNLRENLISQGTVKLEYKVPFVDGLTFATSYNLYQRQIWDKEVNQPYFMYRFETTGANNHILTDVLQGEPNTLRERNDGNWVWQRNQRIKSYQLNFSLNYLKSFGNHNIGATAIYEQYETEYDFTRAQRNSLLSPAVQQINFGSSEDQFAEGSATEGGRLSYAGRVTYNFKEKYFLESSFRYDGSAFFRPDQRWGFFPSYSAAWRISEEGFFNSGVINNLKLKASYGVIGDDSDIGLASWQQLHSLSNGPVLNGNNRVDAITPGSIASDNITWEENTSINYGIETGFFNNRLTALFEIFNTKREGILDNNTATVSTIAGFALPRENTGRVDTKGYELEINYRDNISDDLSYYLGLNYGYATNETVNRVENAGIRPHESRIGRPIGLIWGLTADDIIRTQADLDALPAGYTIFGQVPELGMLNYVDKRGPDSDSPDGVIDQFDRDYIGETIPKIRYGISLGAAYKNWSIDMILQGLVGFDKVLSYRNQSDSFEASNFAFWNDGWTPENTDSKFPRVYGWGGDQGREQSQEVSTFWVEKGDFLRLRNLNIGFQIPERVLEQIGVSRAKIFFNGTNLFLLKSHTKYYDPEGNINTYPLTRNIALGLNITL